MSFPWISFGSLLHKSFSTKWRTASQWAALAHLQKCGHLFGTLPVAQGQEAADRVRTGDWISWLNDLSLCYTGEMVLPAQGLALRQVLPSLPPDEYKGTVEAIALCRALVADQLANPNGLLLPLSASKWLGPAFLQVGGGQAARSWLQGFFPWAGLHQSQSYNTST